MLLITSPDYRYFSKVTHKLHSMVLFIPSTNKKINVRNWFSTPQAAFTNIFAKIHIMHE